MKLQALKPRQALSKAFLKMKPGCSGIITFKANLLELLREIYKFSLSLVKYASTARQSKQTYGLYKFANAVSGIISFCPFRSSLSCTHSYLANSAMRSFDGR